MRFFQKKKCTFFSFTGNLEAVETLIANKANFDNRYLMVAVHFGNKIIENLCDRKLNFL